MNTLRFALRQLARRPGFSITAMLTLALGIALVAVQVSLIDGLLLRPLPFPDADRLVHVAEADPSSGGWRPLTYDTYHAVAARQRGLEALSAFHYTQSNVIGADGVPLLVPTYAVDAGFLPLLRVAPALGRGFEASEIGPGKPLRALISHALWRDTFGADPAVLGRSVSFNGESATVVGVLPPGFEFPGRTRAWVNLRLDPTQPPAWDVPQVEAIGLRLPGLAEGAIAAELSALAADFLRAAGRDDSLATLRVQGVPRAYSGTGTGPLLGTMLAMTLAVLALACINVANLLFVRSADRARELALRNALGAGRLRVLRQLLLESLLLAGGGALIGSLLAMVGIRLLDHVAQATIPLPSYVYFDLNPRVLAAIIGIAALAGLAAGLVPAWRAARGDPAQALRGSSGAIDGGGLGRQRFGHGLIVGQIAFAGGALVVSSLLALSALHASRLNQGFDPDSLLAGRIDLQPPRYASAEQRVAFFQRLLDELDGTPGVVAAAVSSRDLASQGVLGAIEVEGAIYPRAVDRPQVWLEVVSRDYFRVVDRGALRGRLFSADDRAGGPPVALVNEGLAARLWPGEDPLGKRLRRAEPDAPWATVVGVVPDLNMAGVDNGGTPGDGWYLLQDQQAWGWLDQLVRVEGDAQAMIPALRRAVMAVDPQQPLHTLGSLRERTEARLGGRRVVGGMALVFAAAALLLAAVGIYGVMAFAARRRQRELGVRMALGASRGGVVALMLRAGLRQGALGVVVGLLFGHALAQPLAPLLDGTVSGDVRVYLLVGVVLALTALAACWLPARQAALRDPMVVLRSD